MHKVKCHCKSVGHVVSQIVGTENIRETFQNAHKVKIYAVVHRGVNHSCYHGCLQLKFFTWGKNAIFTGAMNRPFGW